MAALALGSCRALPVSAPYPAPTLPEYRAIVVAELGGRADKLAWSPDGGLLASASSDLERRDPVVRISRMRGSTRVLAGHEQPVTALAWSPDGEILATASYDESVLLWDPEGAPRGEIPVRAGAVYALAWSPDSRRVAAGSVAGTSRNSVHVFRPDGSLVWAAATRYSGGKFYNLGFSPDGRYLAGGAIDYILWDSEGNVLFHNETGEFDTPSWGFAWSPDSRRWAFGNESGFLRLYDTEGRLRELLEANGNVDVLAWSPDGGRLAGGGMLWSADGRSVLARPSGTRVRSLAWSPDGATLALARVRAPHVLLCDRDGNPFGMVRGGEAAVEVLSWSPGGLAVGYADGRVSVWRP